MAHLYIATASKASSVLTTLTGNFLDPKALCLVVAKLNHFELFTITAEGLKAFMDVPIYGSIAYAEFFRPAGFAKDLLFFSTESMHFAVLEYNADKGELSTRAKGALMSRVGKPVESGQMGTIDPEARMICLRLYEGLLKLIPVHNARLQDSFDVSLEELNVLDVKFLHKCETPTLAVLHEDPDNAQRSVVLYDVSAADKSITRSRLRMSSVDFEANLLMPVPLAQPGLLVLGQNAVTFFQQDEGRHFTIALPRTAITAVGRVDRDGRRHLLVDHRGGLHMLLLSQSKPDATELKIEALGKVTAASCVSYLDEGVAFVGSHFGDSQVIRLSTEPLSDGTFVEVLDTHTGLGPIGDMCVMTSEHGRSQIVTCSGGQTENTLRIIRNGIGIHQQAVLDMPGVRGIWALAPSLGSQQTVLCVSFAGQTGFLALGGESLDGLEVAGASKAETLCCINVTGDQWLQVTSTSARLIDSVSMALICEWTPPGHATINVCSANTQQVAVAVAATLYCLRVDKGKLVLENSAVLPQEIACVDITPIVEEKATLCMVGLWVDMSVRILSFPALVELHKEVVSADTIPRSAQLVAWGDMAFALCGLGDGCLVSFSLDPLTGALSQPKRVQLGTQPLTMTLFRNATSHSIMVCCDRPAVVHASGRKLVFVNVNMAEVVRMTPINSAAYADSLAFVTREGLVLGQMDDLQRLQITTVHMEDLPVRVAYQSSSKSLCVLTESVPDSDDVPAVGKILLLDEQTFDITDTIKLKPFELGFRVASVRFHDDDNEYYCVGVAEVKAEEPEVHEGRLLVLRVSGGKFVLEAEAPIKGAPFALCMVRGKLVSAVNGKVALFNWRVSEGGRRQLVLEFSHSGYIELLQVASHGDHVLLGDLMRSVSLLAYKPSSSSLEMVACDARDLWVTASAFVDGEHVVAADNNSNIRTWKIGTQPTLPEEHGRLDPLCEFHLGDNINVIQHGSLAMRDGERKDSMLMASVAGALYVAAPLSKLDFDFLQQVQARVLKHVRGVGGLIHEEHRACKTLHNPQRVVGEFSGIGVIDGDLVERLLDLPNATIALIADGLEFLDSEGHVVKANADNLVRRIEDFSRLH